MTLTGDKYPMHAHPKIILLYATPHTRSDEEAHRGNALSVPTLNLNK